MSDLRPFSALAEPELERRVARDLELLRCAVAAELGSDCSALLLGGGYGRGEGGGERDATGAWQPLNDYDLVALVQGVPRFRLAALRRRLDALARDWERELAIEVELSPLRSEELPHLPFTMMWCEMLAEPRLLHGRKEALARARPLPPAQLPAIEGLRYLANRAALLLWARLEPLPPTRVWKFVGKAWLACGAATLIARHRFAVGYTARQSLLDGLDASDLPPVPTLVARHRRALEERLRPTPPPADLESEVDCAIDAVLGCWRWAETLRLEWAAPSWETYAGRPGLFREANYRRPELVLRHLRWLGRRGLSPWAATGEHPRARLLRALPAALAREVSPAAERLVGGPASRLAERCLELWRQVQA
ncbi:MAG: hypothetical protein KBF21_05555 [Thermoanaerobaculia bacterium]|nr:hypothetical protein [Thermoanaerobaculia bacterium]MBP9823671.1 hypothetical protein [Thermoanaerobaculia bacterium]